MTPLVVWARRGSGRILAPVVSGFLLASAFQSHPWLLDSRWATRAGASAVALVTPVLAAAVAYDVVRGVRPGLAEVGSSSVRGRWVALAPTVAAWGWALLPFVVAWAVVPVVVRSLGGAAGSDPWLYVEVAATLGAAACVGMAIGSWIEGLTGVVVAAGAVLTAQVVLESFDVRLFQVAVSSGTMIGIERTPERAVALVGVAAAVILGAIRAERCARSERPGPRRSPALVGVGVAVVIMAVAGIRWSDGEYRPTREPTVCLGTAPILCGPRSARPLLIPAQRDLAVGRSALAGSSLPLPDVVHIARGDAVRELPDDAALLDYDPSQTRAGHLPRETVSATFALPRVCADLFRDAESAVVLERIRTVREYLDTVLDGNGKPGPAPPAVAGAYRWLKGCEPVGPGT